MTPWLIATLILAFVAALASVVLGRNLTRSIFAAGTSLAAIGLALIQSGGGYPAWFALAGAVLALALVQLFGWMLVDVERDHLPPTDGFTALARGVSFLLLAVGLVLLGFGLFDAGLSTDTPRVAVSGLLARGLFVGDRFLGVLGAGVSLIGFLLAATLLASLMLLRGDGRNR